MLQLELALMATSWVHLATMAASLATQVTLLANLEGHNASPKVCLGTFLGLLHRLGTRLGLAILAATSLGLARLSKWPHRCTVARVSPHVNTVWDIAIIYRHIALI